MYDECHCQLIFESASTSASVGKISKKQSVFNYLMMAGRKFLLTNAITYAYQPDNEEDAQLQDVVPTQFAEAVYFEVGREFVTKLHREEQYDENIDQESTGNIGVEYIANSTPRNLKKTAELINKSVMSKVGRKRKIQDEVCDVVTEVDREEQYDENIDQESTDIEWLEEEITPFASSSLGVTRN